MGKWKLKSCPRCGGDLFIGRDLDNNWYEQCLQCSCQHDMENIARFSEHQSVKRKKPTLAGSSRGKRQKMS